MSDEKLTNEEVLELPAKSRFLIFILTLFRNKMAKFNKDNNNFILLEPYPSNFFIIGRDTDDSKFIGVQDSMIPWFMEMSWNKVAIDKEAGYIYLYCGTEHKSDLVLGVKVRKKRLGIFQLEDGIDEDEVHFKIFKQKTTNKTSKVLISENNYATLPLIETSRPLDLAINQDDESEDDGDEFDYNELDIG